MRKDIKVAVLILTIALIATVPNVAADPVGAFVAKGTIQYENGTTCPSGWNLEMENLDQYLEGEPWTTTTYWVPPCYDYYKAGETVADSDRIRVNITSPDGIYKGTNTKVASEAFDGSFVIINVTVYEQAAPTYTISGYTDPIADKVNITNLNKSDIIDDRPTDYIDPVTGFYNLTLNVSAEVEAGNVLQIVACDVISDYESNCNVSTHEVVNVPGEDDNVNLTLNHYCLNYYPSYPFHTWEHANWSGPAVMEMLIDHYRDPPRVPSQAELNATGIAHNQQPCNADLSYVDPKGMQWTLNDILHNTSGGVRYANYGIGSYTAVEGALHYICYWHYLGPGAAPTYGDYSSWMAVRGIHTSENPKWKSEGSYDIYGFWINDPNPTGGIGENTYKSVDQWTGTYFKNLTGVRDGDSYKNRYVAVCEPPEQPDVDVRLVHSKARFGGVIIADATDEELTVDVDGVPLDQLICSRKLDRENESKVVQAAIDSVNEGLIPYDPDFAEAFDATVADKPMQVKSDAGEYYLVPFCTKPNGKSVSAVVIVDSDGGKFKEASWVKEPAKYLPVTAQEALKIVYKEMKGKSTVKGKQSRKAYLELVCRDSSPYYPDWEITIGDKTYFVSQDGTVETGA